MKATPVAFRFDDHTSAVNAFNTLNELGYQPEFIQGNPKGLLFFINDEDLTAALEIAQANGGSLAEDIMQRGEQEVLDCAYAMGELDIPAHLVNEDWTEAYASGEASQKDGSAADAAPGDDAAYRYGLDSPIAALSAGGLYDADAGAAQAPGAGRHATPSAQGANASAAASAGLTADAAPAGGASVNEADSFPASALQAAEKAALASEMTPEEIDATFDEELPHLTATYDFMDGDVRA